MYIFLYVNVILENLYSSFVSNVFNYLNKLYLKYKIYIVCFIILYNIKHLYIVKMKNCGKIISYKYFDLSLNTFIIYYLLKYYYIFYMIN